MFVCILHPGRIQQEFLATRVIVTQVRMAQGPGAWRNTENFFWRLMNRLAIVVFFRAMDRLGGMDDSDGPARGVMTKAELDAVTVGGARPHGDVIRLVEYDAAWPVRFEAEAARIWSALGATARRAEHVGSTSVPGLAAKPILDVVLEVTDSREEDAYVPALVAIGYELRIREPDWFEHRVLKLAEPDVNLHVFTAVCGEVERMVRFRDHLRVDAADRALYEAAKRELAARVWAYVQNYADAKTEVIARIMERV